MNQARFRPCVCMERGCVGGGCALHSIVQPGPPDHDHIVTPPFFIPSLTHELNFHSLKKLYVHVHCKFATMTTKRGIEKSMEKHW